MVGMYGAASMLDKYDTGGFFGFGADNGRLNKHEFGNLLKGEFGGVSRRDRNKAFKAADTNGDGKISTKELKNFMNDMKDMDSTSNCRGSKCGGMNNSNRDKANMKRMMSDIMDALSQAMDKNDFGNNKSFGKNSKDIMELLRKLMKMLDRDSGDSDSDMRDLLSQLGNKTGGSCCGNKSGNQMDDLMSALKDITKALSRGNSGNDFGGNYNAPSNGGGGGGMPNSGSGAPSKPDYTPPPPATGKPNPDTVIATRQDMKDDMKDADINRDGKLNRAETGTFLDTMNDRADAKGATAQFTEGQKDALFKKHDKNSDLVLDRREQRHLRNELADGKAPFDNNVTVGDWNKVTSATPQQAA